MTHLEMLPTINIGETIRNYRLQKGMSQGDIEKRTGLLRCYLSRVESGHTVPSLDTLAKIAQALDIPLAQFFAEDSLGREMNTQKLTDDELRWLWKACEKERFPMGYIVRLLILTLARRNEVSGIRDREVHLGNRRTWILPAPRTKNHNEHEIFMTDAMIETIKAVPRVKNKEGYFFSTNGKTPFGGFSKAKKRLDALMLEIAQEEDPEITVIKPWRLHDLRRTGATRMQRLGFEKEVVDCCLNHIDDDAYLQHDYYDNMAKAFDAWSREVVRIVFAVLPSAVKHESPALAPVG